MKQTTSKDQQSNRKLSASAVKRGNFSARTFYQPDRLDKQRAVVASANELSDKRQNDEEPLPIIVRVALIAFILALIFPITFSVGSAAFTGTRAFLTLGIIPILVLAMRLPSFSKVDLLIPLYAIWSAVCFIANQGASGIEASGSHFIEVAGSYFLARLLFKDTRTFIYWSKILFWTVLFLLPFGAIESFTGKPVVLDTLRNFVSVFPDVDMPKRLGLDRAQVTFEHPILYGVFCAGAFSYAVMIFSKAKSLTGKYFRGLVVISATFFSLSSGAYINIVWQIVIATWNFALRTVKRRWLLLFTIVAAFYVFVDVLSNRTPFEVFISYFTFDLNSSYTRVLQWKYGTASVFNNPIFGLGLFTDYPRPNWLTKSLDNFWLLRAMRFGFPGIIMLLLIVGIGAYGLTKRMVRVGENWSTVSTAQFCTLIGTCISLVTVDVWSGSHVMFFFTIGTIVALNESYNLQLDISHREHDHS